MKAIESIEPITALKTKPAQLIRRVQQSGSPLVITQNGKASAILMDVAVYEKQRQTLLLLKALVQGEQDYRAGRVKSHRAAKTRLKNKLAELKTRGD